MIRKLLINGTISLFMVVAFPLSSYATDQAGSSTDPTPAATTQDAQVVPDSSISQPPATTSSDSQGATDGQTSSQPNPGPAAPTGPDANTYTYNSVTGLWENQYYTWDSVTHQSTPKNPPTYSYNPVTGMWDTTQWVYDSAQGKYVPNVIASSAIAPAGMSAPVATAATALATNADIAGNGVANSTNNASTNNSFFDNFYNASISNQLSSSAVSGNALVANNTTAGSALSGNALDVSNIINMLQSQWNLQSAANLLTFVDNINGDVTGDITIDLAPAPTGTSQTNNNVTINNQGSGLITNDITVGATSGDATVSGNANAGNATSGNANAVADVVNVLNTAISAGQSFLGVVNINGNLNGDILLPPNFVDQLIATGAPSSVINLSQSQNSNVVADSTNTQTINNNVKLTAASGDATVANNTNAGNATTGNASTNLTIFNLTGSNVIATNSLLVFVNVLGQWVGLIMNAPAGSTTAALCGGSCQSSTVVNNSLTLASANQNTINNNVSVNSRSGDATVANNTNAGNAKTGSASSSANILNISSSNFSLSDWFGILFINVLGTWHGSFGINTDAGNPIVSAGGDGLGFNSGFHAPAGSGDSPAKVFVFGFVPGTNGKLNVTQSNATITANSSDQTGKKQQPVVLGVSTDKPSAPTPQLASAGFNWGIPAVAAGIFALSLGAGYLGELSDKLNIAWTARKLRQH